MSAPNLWDIAVKQRNEVLEGIENGSIDSSNTANESHLLVCGSKNAGKSTLVLRFLERDEPPKPTAGLDFCYGKKSKQNSVTTVKDIVHVWELGGGSTMSSLVDTVITPSNIRTISVVLVLDLSQPYQLWETQNVLLTQIKERIHKVIAESKSSKMLEEDLKKRAWERFGSEHNDKNIVTPLLIPLLIIGSKFDVFQELTGEQKQLISKTLRFLTHIHGGMLQFYSIKAEGLTGRAKAAVSHLAFKTTLSSTSSLESNKPVIAPFGSDHLELIGAPPVSSDLLARSRGNTPIDLWRTAFLSVFPTEKEEKQKSNPGVDPKYADPVIDEVRAQKDQELAQYRKVSERKANEALVNARVGENKSAKKTKVR